MGLTSIEWTDFTFNPWWGCSKVSAGCANCYAEGVAERFATGNLWGKDAQRKHASDKVWNDPLRWNKAAEKAGRRDLVFCASMADVFEDRSDLDEPRKRLWGLIRATPWLRWLLLTKRPENFHLLPPDVAELVALGVSVENQEAADKRVPLLLSAPAAIRFVSCEPMLGPVVLRNEEGYKRGNDYDWLTGDNYVWLDGTPGPRPAGERIDWVICGGESGKGARPMHPDWIRSLRDQCQAASVPFLFKQWGEWLTYREQGDGFLHPLWIDRLDPSYNISIVEAFDAKGSRWDYPPGGCLARRRIGKHAAGRLLDGREHLEFPANIREVRP